MKKLFFIIFLVTIFYTSVHALPQCKGENKLKLLKPLKWHKCIGTEKIDDDKYEGEYRFGKFDGNGTYYFASGEKYTGEFKKGKMDGFGIYIDSNGKVSSVAFNEDYLVGQVFKIDINDGKHTYEYANGYKYNGYFVDGFRNGKGTLISGDNNEKFVGDFKNGFRHGKGTLALYKSDSHYPYLFYDGEWKYDQKNGKGEEEYANGSKHVGTFVNNNINGEGTFIFANGDKCHGYWNNKFVSLSPQESHTKKINLRKIKNLEKRNKLLIKDEDKSKEEKEKMEIKIKKEIDELLSEIPVLSYACKEFIRD